MIIYHFKKDVFLNTNRSEIYNENNELVCWTQNDFSYKNRKHFYDSKDNEVGYAQLDLKNNVSHIYGVDDKLFGDIDLIEFKTTFTHWKIDTKKNLIEDNNGNEVMHMEYIDETFYMHINNNADDLNCIICLIGLADYIKLQGVIQNGEN